MGTIKDGVFYNSEGEPEHCGIVEVDGKFYYASKEGKIVKDRKKVVHRKMANDLVDHGTYYFDKDGVIDFSSYRKPSKRKSTHSSHSSGSSHSSHSSHTSHSGNSKNHKKTIKIFTLKRGFLIAALLLLLAVSVPGGALFKYFTNREAGAEESGKSRKDRIEITIPEYTEEVYLCSGGMQNYYAGKTTLDQAVESSSTPYSPFVFAYRVEGAKSAVLTLGEKQDLSDGTEYPLNVKAGEITVDNLKTGTRYYFNVTAKDENDNKKTADGSFQTANTNRFILLDGVTNTRDIGGYEIPGNKRVKQGLLIRGTELDGLAVTDYYLSDPQQAKPLGFVYDFDLRSPDIYNMKYTSRLGETVGHRFYNAPSYGGIFSKAYEDNLKTIFADLANRKNYPMYMHCTFGTDRTGTVILLLQGLLGVSEQDMQIEYGLSGFLNRECLSKEKTNPIFSGLESVPGKTINEKIENYMVSTIGVTKEQIRNIREIFLEEKP